jgi:hypothetical protein
MDRHRARSSLAAALASVAMVAAGVAVVGAAPSGKGRCHPRKAVCEATTATPTSTTSTSTTSTSTTTTAPSDTTAPVVAIASPTAGSTVTDRLAISGSSSDDHTVVRVDVRIDGGSWQAASGTSTWSSTADAAAWADGSTHTVAARSVDAAGNTSSTATVSVQKAASPEPVTADASTAPATQGTWVSPEGATIDVATAEAWTIRDIYRMLLENATAPGDFAEVAPTLTVKVQDSLASQTTTTARTSDGVYVRFSATVYLKAIGSTFSSQPDSQLAHEYGHAWTMYHLFMSRGGDWAPYLDARWSNVDGSVRLASDSRLDSSYAWDRREIVAEDYRLLFGSPAATGQRPTHMNPDIVEPGAVPGLRDHLLGR